MSLVVAVLATTLVSGPGPTTSPSEGCEWVDLGSVSGARSVVVLWDGMATLCEAFHKPPQEAPHVQVQASRPRDTTYRGMGTDWEQWRPLVAAWFPPDLVDTAVCVIRWESGGNPDAKNPESSARGLFQILASLWAPHFSIAYNDLYDPVLNVEIARRVYDSQGWRAWSVYKKGLCS